MKATVLKQFNKIKSKLTNTLRSNYASKLNETAPKYTLEKLLNIFNALEHNKEDKKLKVTEIKKVVKKYNTHKEEEVKTITLQIHGDAICQFKSKRRIGKKYKEQIHENKIDYEENMTGLVQICYYI